MKKHFLFFIALIALSFTVNAQPRPAKIAKFKSPERLGNFEIQQIFSSFDRSQNIGTLELRRLRQGRNHLLTDRRTGNKLMLLAERRGAKVKVVGFMVQTPAGGYHKLSQKTTGKAKPGIDFGCPDGWDSTLVCYNNPNYGKVCYLRCTPTQLTLKFPPSF
jgi:hypothetical protein